MRSKMAAMPWPPPMHIVTSARRPPVRFSSYRALIVRMQPVAPIGWPSEMPLPLGLVRSGGSSRPAAHRQRLGRERLVDLEHVDVFQAQAGLLEQRLHRRHRADAHVLRVHAGVAVGHQPAHRLQAALLGQAALHQHHRRRRVVDARGVAGRHGAVRIEHRLQPGQLFRRAVAADRLVDLERNCRPS